MPLVLRQYYVFEALSQRQLVSSDFDAEHPIYLWLISKYGLDPEQSLWLSFLYMAFYDEASAWVVFQETDPFTVPTNVKFPIGTNRRNLLGGKILTHFSSLKKLRESATDWPIHNFTGDRLVDWKLLKANIGEVWGNGRFGIYTTAEMLHKVNKLPVEVGDFDNTPKSRPTDGVQRLFGLGRYDALLLDKFAEYIYQKTLANGLHPSYTTLDRGVIESILCNFSGVCRGRFYSGRNLDRQQDRITKVEGMGYALPELWEAREAVLRRCDLGEYNGWNGVDKPRMKVYLERGEIPWTYEMR